MSQAVAASFIDRDIGGDLWKMDRRLHPQCKGVTDVDRRNVRKTDERLAAGDRVVRVNEVRRLDEISKIVNDHNPLRCQFRGHFAKLGRVDDRPVAAPQQATCDVPHDDLRSVAVVEPDVGEQDDKSVAHLR